MKKQEAIDYALNFMHVLLSDIEGTAALITDDFVWENFLPDHMPFGGRYEEGLEGLKRYMSEMGPNWRIGAMDFKYHVFDPETQKMVSRVYEAGGGSLITGRDCDLDAVWEWHFSEDGKLSYVREYNDTEVIGSTFDK